MFVGDMWQLQRWAGAAALVVVVMATLAPALHVCSAHTRAYGSSSSSEVLHKRPYKNFLRFGRNNMADTYDNVGPVHAVVVLPAEALKRANPNRNFIRFGRGGALSNKNFLRFGRGGSTRLLPQLLGTQAPQKDFPPSAAEATNQHEATGRAKRSLVEEEEEQPHQRGRRALPNLMTLVTHPQLSSPIDWLPETDDMEGFHYGDAAPYAGEELTEGDMMDLHDIQKRKFPLNFVRYGREPSDWNFIRFGKRGSGEVGDDVGEYTGPAEEYDNIVRGRNNKNFLRFGR